MNQKAIQKEYRSLFERAEKRTREAFGYSGGYYYWMSKAFDLFAAGLFWILGCIPVVTAGASTAALYTAIRRSILSDEKSVSETFWQAFRANLKMGVLHGLAVTAVITILLWNFGIARARLGGDARIGFMTLYLIAAALAGMAARYLFVLISRFDMPFGWYTKSALYAMVRHLPVSLALLGIWMAAYYLIWRYFLLILILPGLAALASSKLTEKAVRDFEP